MSYFFHPEKGKSVHHNFASQVFALRFQIKKVSRNAGLFMFRKLMEIQCQWILPRGVHSLVRVELVALQRISLLLLSQ